MSKNFFEPPQDWTDLHTGKSSAERWSGLVHGRRPLRDSEVADFMVQADVRSDKPPGKPNAQLLKLLKLKNRWRWWRLRRDFKWAQSVAAKGKFNPEEVRFLL